MSVAGTIPQYRQVANTLRRRITSGEYSTGETLPAAVVLEQIFSVSNITIRKAIDLLAADGLVQGRRGVGTIVTKRPDPTGIEVKLSGNFAEWLDTASGEDKDIEQQVLSIGAAPAPAAVAEIFDLEAQAELWTMRRVRRLHGETISLHVNYGQMKDFDFIAHATMSGVRSFVDVMRKECAFTLARMDQRVVAATADRDLNELLEVEFGAPMFMVENVYTAAGGRPVAVSHLYLRGDRYSYQASISLRDEA